MNVLITGGAGFIGSNTAAYYLKRGDTVRILDNFTRKGSKLNIRWLNEKFENKFEIIHTDIRCFDDKLTQAVKGADLIVHLAAQVAVTTSVTNPREDFEINALGTFNVLEAVRLSGHNPVFIYSSTNKVYGGLEDIKTSRTGTRYRFDDLKYGINEKRNIDFHSPYGCSKGAADQYVRDYARIYGLNTIVFRQSCIYGPRQFGVEDQGWIAWFIIALSQNKNITIYGDGKQVRDLLYVDDLVSAYDMAYRNIAKTRGGIYNIGGGYKHSISVWYELRPMLEELFGKKISARFDKTRPGDQPIFISDIRKAKKDFAWEPEIPVNDGISRLYKWVVNNKDLFKAQ